MRKWADLNTRRHLMHFSLLICAGSLLAPPEIAALGQVFTHRPQALQSSGFTVKRISAAQRPTGQILSLMCASYSCGSI